MALDLSAMALLIASAGTLLLFSVPEYPDMISVKLDAILANSWLVKDVPSKAHSKNQRSFERMLIMEYVCNGVGRVKMTVE